MRVQKGLHETACFTGHRRLGMTERELEKKTLELIQKAYFEKGISHFIYGGALGFDMIAAEQVLFLKDATHNGILTPITLEIAIPCENQTRGWSKRQRQRYDWILAQVDVKHERDVPYSPYAMQKRNEFMVSKSALVIAYYEDGRTGGTKNTLDYAEKHKREIWFVK